MELDEEAGTKARSQEKAQGETDFFLWSSDSEFLPASNKNTSYSHCELIIFSESGILKHIFVESFREAIWKARWEQFWDEKFI